MPIIEEPSLKDRLGAAIFVVSFGAQNTGVMTRHKLMFPYTAYDDDDVKRAAARLLTSVHTALLATLPPSRTEQILIDLAAYLSFAHGDGWPDEKTPYQAAE